jgi:hypothetical protein
MEARMIEPAMDECIEACLDCYKTCLSMASGHCLEVGGAHVEKQHFVLMLACAEICRTAAHFMLLGSRHYAHVCAECAEICRQCAKDCERLGDMAECVAACQRCETACHAMALQVDA